LGDKSSEIHVHLQSTEFEIDKEYVGRVVGSQGAGVNKLRDQLGVKVDVSDEADEKEKEGGKKKKAAHQKCHVKITGRKENAEEAKKRILAQVERLVGHLSLSSTVVVNPDYRLMKHPRSSRFLPNIILH
jgi:predicted PilT family ATPase